MNGAGFSLPHYGYSLIVLGDPTVNLSSSIECLLDAPDLK